jgi:hypothetical protein
MTTVMLSKSELYAALVALGRPSTLAEVARSLGPAWAEQGKRVDRLLNSLNREGCVSKTKGEHGRMVWCALTAQRPVDVKADIIEAIRSFPGEEFTAADIAKIIPQHGKVISVRLSLMKKYNWVIPTRFTSDAVGNRRQAYRRSSRIGN